MSELSRRSILTSAATAGTLMATAAVAVAQTADNVPQPSRAPGVGGTDPHPGSVARELQNPDLLNPPSTDSGTVPNLRFSFADGHMRQSSGGWTRQVTVRELGISKSIAGVNMRLNAGGVRELHWHKQAEWAYMLYGNARITAIDAQGGISSMTWAWAICGISRAAFRIRSRVSDPTDASSCWFLTMANSTKIPHSC